MRWPFVTRRFYFYTSIFLLKVPFLYHDITESHPDGTSNIDKGHSKRPPMPTTSNFLLQQEVPKEFVVSAMANGVLSSVAS